MSPARLTFRPASISTAPDAMPLLAAAVVVMSSPAVLSTSRPALMSTGPPTVVMSSLITTSLVTRLVVKVTVPVVAVTPLWPLTIVIVPAALSHTSPLPS